MSQIIKDSSRFFAFDALRGLAVFLMMEQHMGVWLWNQSLQSAVCLPALIGFNALGGLAAPLFVTLAGVGCSLQFLNRSKVDFTVVKRGGVLFVWAILLNILTPSWFTIGSWFVLHMIAFAMITAPLWRRQSNRCLMGLMGAILVATVWLQNYLNTPLRQSNLQMSSFQKPGGVFRLAFVEGHFPIFPWLSMFLMGVLVGRWIQERSIRKILRLAGVMSCFLALLVVFKLLIVNVLEVEVVVESLWYRVFVWDLSFYPAHPIVFLLLQIVVLLLIAIAMKVQQAKLLQANNYLVCLGRVSLTLLIVHVVLFREVSRPLGLWHGLSTWSTLAVIGLWVWASMLVARCWQRTNYRYSAEWTLRQLAK